MHGVKADTLRARTMLQRLHIVVVSAIRFSVIGSSSRTTPKKTPAIGIIKTKEFTPQYLKKSIDEFYSALLRQQIRKPKFLFNRFMENPLMFFKLGFRLLRKMVAS